jgi:amidase
MKAISVEQSGAFVEQFTLPPTAEGALSGLRFAVKDLIDVAGRRTGCGNPTWLATHPPAAVSAICVEQLLAAGAHCVGKTVTDEVAYSLLGENRFYGTPLNAAAPGRVPGGSSSGSASAVACGLVDFALGTDTGGSVRVPASYCGVWGLRPSHGVISVAGVMPLSPTFDTVGVLARNIDTLQRSAEVLVGGDAVGDASSGDVYLLTDAFSLADDEVQSAIEPLIDRFKSFLGDRVREVSLGELCRDAEAGDLFNWLNMYRFLQGVEALSCLGAWVEEVKPELGPSATAGLAFARTFDRGRISEVMHRRERYARRLQQALGENDLLCMPTAPTVAPRKGQTSYDRGGDYYRCTLSLTSIAGVARLPQVSMPLAAVSGVPVGLSLLASRGQDLHLLKAAGAIAQVIAER